MVGRGATSTRGAAFGGRAGAVSGRAEGIVDGAEALEPPEGETCWCAVGRPAARSGRASGGEGGAWVDFCGESGGEGRRTERPPAGRPASGEEACEGEAPSDTFGVACGSTGTVCVSSMVAADTLRPAAAGEGASGDEEAFAGRAASPAASGAAGRTCFVVRAASGEAGVLPFGAGDGAIACAIFDPRVEASAVGGAGCSRAAAGKAGEDGCGGW